MPARARMRTISPTWTSSSRTPKYFTVGTIAAGATTSLEDSWTLTLTRVGASAGYGAYTVIFTEEGYDATNSTHQGQAGHQPDADLIGVIGRRPTAAGMKSLTSGGLRARSPLSSGAGIWHTG